MIPQINQIKSFSGKNSSQEYFIVITPEPQLSFIDQLQELQFNYQRILREQNIKSRSIVFKKFFVSDIANQMEELKKSKLFSGENENDLCAVSVIEQPPLNGAKLLLLAYHIAEETPLKKVRLAPYDIFIQRQEVSQFWYSNFNSTLSDKVSTSENTETVFSDLVNKLKYFNSTLLDNTIRTWLYIENIDRNYYCMANKRKELFIKHGLTPETHYIASTGIEGKGTNPNLTVNMDALSLIGLKNKQVNYLNDFDHLCKTINYNVTFERGTKISYQDRSHIFISGTASIDKYGDVIHENDVIKQTARTLKNIEALLEKGNATLSDMMYLIVYLRDLTDALLVKDYIINRINEIPIIILLAPVCRPNWLVEIEGLAIIKCYNKELPVF